MGADNQGTGLKKKYLKREILLLLQKSIWLKICAIFYISEIL